MKPKYIDSVTVMLTTSMKLELLKQGNQSRFIREAIAEKLKTNKDGDRYS